MLSCPHVCVGKLYIHNFKYAVESWNVDRLANALGGQLHVPSPLNPTQTLCPLPHPTPHLILPRPHFHPHP